MKHKYKLLLSFLFFLSIPLKTMGEEVSIEIETEKSKIDIQNESFEASDGVILKYGDITLRADNMKKLENRNVILASGNVLLTQGTEKVLADEVEFDLDTKKAIIKSSKAYDSNLQLYFGGEETISEYPSKITINNAWFTPSP
ncbi:MAG: LPS-assembly protein LptD, partial [Leptotrichiaceae bacterium]